MAESELFKTVLAKAMALCSRREYCSFDIQNKLVSWGVGSFDAEKITACLINEKFIDEKRYASAFVKDKFNYNKWGKIKIAAHLRAKKVDQVIIKSALDSIDYDTYVATMKTIISIHKRTIKAKNKYDLKAKLLRYGLSKGFESSLVYDILGEE